MNKAVASATVVLLLSCFVWPVQICTSTLLDEETVAAPSYKKEIRPLEVDHSEFEALKADFESGPEVTAACLGCHDGVGQEILETHHWTWSCPNKRGYKIGKLGLSLNNSSLSPVPNKFACYKCHISYRWEDHGLPLEDATTIDCLTCHEQTNGMYDDFKKNWNPNLNKIAQNIGKPTSRNCGACHFYRSGGDGAMRGDLSSKLLTEGRDHDVHMGTNSPNLDCIDCHVTVNHTISGRCYEAPAVMSDSDASDRFDCTFCHSQGLHKTIDKINDHLDRVACETCHIPVNSRDQFSRVWADFSTAGEKKNGQAVILKNEEGYKEYSTMTGDCRWAKDIIPQYHWFSGGFRYTLANEVIDPSRRVKLNDPNTSFNDAQAKIYPFKVHVANQPYDKINNTMVLPKFTDQDKNSGAYWTDYNWDKAIAAGMQEAGLPYSGNYGFIETEYLYPIHHAVVPKEKSLTCTDCHQREHGRLENLTGFYMPGRDRSLLIDYSGLLSIFLVCFGVIWHARYGSKR